MKKSLIALAVLAASGAAMAQSSVTLYGVADAGVTYLNGADNWSGVTSGNNLASLIGFRGVEDLGGGLKANFVLEADVNLDTGAGKYLDAGDGQYGATDSGFRFKRQSTVGLAGNFGAVRLGRELTAAYNATARYDVFGSVGIARSQLWDDGKNLDTTTFADRYHYTTDRRVSNAITYVSPNFSGFKAAVNYGFGEMAGKNRDGRYFGGGLTYDNGPLSLGLGAERLNNGAGAAMQVQASNDITAWSLGGSYDLGVAKLLAGYRQSTAKDVLGLGDLKNRGYMLAATAPVGPGLVRAAYNRYEAKFYGEKGVTDQFGLGYVYNLSKRTSVYGTYAYIKNKNDNALNLTVNSYGGVKSNGSQQAVQVGVTHAF